MPSHSFDRNEDIKDFIQSIHMLTVYTSHNDEELYTRHSVEMYTNDEDEYYDHDENE